MKKLTIKDFEKRPADDVMKEIKNNDIVINVGDYNKVVDYFAKPFNPKRLFWCYAIYECSHRDLRNEEKSNCSIEYYKSLFNTKKLKIVKPYMRVLFFFLVIVVISILLNLFFTLMKLFY